MMSAVDSGVAPGRRRSTRHQRAWYWYDWANSAYVTTTATVLYAPYLTTVAKAAACPGLPDGARLPRRPHVLGIPVAPGSLALYTLTVATIAVRRSCSSSSAPSPTAPPAADAPVRRLRLGRRRSPRPDGLRRRHQLAAGRRARRSSPASASAPRSSSTTRSCADIADAGRARPRLQPRLGVRLPRRRPAARAQPRPGLLPRPGSASTEAPRSASACCRRACGGPAFTLIPLPAVCATCRARWRRPVDGRGGRRRWQRRASCGAPSATCATTRRRCSSCSPTCSTTTASRP